jgi:hypothetical protein
MTSDWPTLLLVGALYQPRWGRPLTVNISALPRATRSPDDGENGWSRYVFTTPDPIADYIESRGTSGGYQYHLALRVSGTRFLLAAGSQVVVEHVTSALSLRGRVTSPTIDIPKLVAQLASPGAVYSMSAVWARV